MFSFSLSPFLFLFLGFDHFIIVMEILICMIVVPSSELQYIHYRSVSFIAIENQQCNKWKYRQHVTISVGPSGCCSLQKV